MDSFQGLVEGGARTTWSVDSDPQSMMAISDEFVPEGIRFLLDATLMMGGNTATKPEDIEFEMTLSLDDQLLVEIVEEGYDLYGRADVWALVDRFGEDRAQVEALIESLPPSLDFAEEAAAGEWIHLVGLQEIVEGAGGAGDPSQLVGQQQQLLEALETTLEDAELTEGTDEGPGTNLEVALEAAPLFDSFMDMASTTGQLPKGMSEEMLRTQIEQLGDREVILDMWVDGDEVTQMRLDLIENAESLGDPMPEGVERMAILVELEPWERKIPTPADPVEVDVLQVLTAVMSGDITRQASTPKPEPSFEERKEARECRAIAKVPKKVRDQYNHICEND